MATYGTVRGVERAHHGWRAGELARAYFAEVVQPLLADQFPRLTYSAARLGAGSDVLGLDDLMSQDHDWGLRLNLFVPDGRVTEVDAALSRALPPAFRGLPTRFAFTGSADRPHRVEVDTLGGFLTGQLGFDPRAGMTTRDWLSLTGQAVLEVTAGPVFVDESQDLAAARAALNWYPDDVWRYVLAADWARFEQELPLMSRAGYVGDERGSRIIAARLSQVAMHMAFMLARRWPPYSKWVGTLFRDLPHADVLGSALDRTLRAATWPERQVALADLLQTLLDVQNNVGLTSVDAATIAFWDRPFVQPDSDIASQLLAAVEDPEVQALPAGWGSIEQRTDVVEVLVDPSERRRLTKI